VPAAGSRLGRGDESDADPGRTAMVGFAVTPSGHRRRSEVRALRLPRAEAGRCYAIWRSPDTASGPQTVASAASRVRTPPAGPGPAPDGATEPPARDRPATGDALWWIIGTPGVGHIPSAMNESYLIVRASRPDDGPLKGTDFTSARGYFSRSHIPTCSNDSP
jgi:hypothetical protein